MPADQVTAPRSPRSYPMVDPAPDNERVPSRPPDLARVPSTRFGVAFRLLAAFAAVTVFAAATSIFALYAFDRYRIGFNELASKKLPVLAAASELAQRSEKLSANAPALAAVESHFARQAVRQELNEQLESLSRVSDYLERLSSELSSLADLNRYKQVLTDNLDHLDKMVAQRIDAEAAVERALTRLGIVSGRIHVFETPAALSLEETADGREALWVWAAAANAQVAVLLSTATAENGVRLQQLRSVFTQLRDQAHTALTRVPASYRQGPNGINELLDQYGAGASNIFDARAAQLDAASGVRRNPDRQSTNFNQICGRFATILRQYQRSCDKTGFVLLRPQ